MPLQGKDGGTWKDASAVYGKSGGNWLYAKSVWANKAGTWTRAWTDCRKHDEGGRDWTAAAGVTEYQGSCSTRESRVRTDYSKTGCTGYSRYTSWTSSPDCGSVGSSCWTDVTCNYINSSNFVFGGVTFTGVFDPGGACIGYNDTNCFYTLWTCGSTQGTTSVCF
jgi:hypothetical protein